MNALNKFKFNKSLRNMEKEVMAGNLVEYLDKITHYTSTIDNIRTKFQDELFFYAEEAVALPPHWNGWAELCDFLVYLISHLNEAHEVNAKFKDLSIQNLIGFFHQK
ncbi:MAG: hypothetical protein LBJ09_00975 [Clostridiales bacterium]|nr:hypothetical protein [Clostridiales bacterium]